jgi:histidine ammonia-lyase
MVNEITHLFNSSKSNSMKNIYQTGKESLDFQIIRKILTENLKIELSAESIQKIQKCRDYLDRKIQTSEQPVYGITTGFGSLCNKNISPAELTHLQENLVKSHACSMGEELPQMVIKLMMLLKIHALSLGHSGVQVATVQRIVDFFNNDIIPVVYDRGSLGASGDLAPLANLFLPLIGEGEVFFEGKRQSAKEILQHFDFHSKCQSKNLLRFLSHYQHLLFINYQYL